MRPERRRRLQQLSLSLGTVVVLLLALETAARFRQWFKYGTFEGSVHVQEVDEATGLAVPRPGVIEGDSHRIVVNEHGFRSPPLTTPRPEGLRRIAFLGASTTFCAEASTNETTWPHQVFEGLRAAFPDTSMDYLNASVGGYAVHHSLRNLRSRVAPWEPDVLVVYHAINDLSYLTTEQAQEEGLDVPGPWQPSWLARYSLLVNLFEKNLQMREVPTAHAATLDPEPGPHAALFEESLRELVAAAREMSPVVVLVTFSHRVRPDQTPAEQEEATHTSRFYARALDTTGILRGVEAYNQVIRRVARDTGCVLVEDEHAIPADGVHFADSVHLTDAGCQAQADRVLSVMTAAPEVVELMQEPATRD